MNAIETIGLTKSFRNRRVIDDLNMHVPRGAIYGFVGKNGSGKSTTMKLVCGMMPPTSGEVRVMGEPMGACEASPFIGSLVEAPGIYPNLSAFDNMMVKALALGLPECQKQCRKLLKTVGLDSTGKQKAKKFSMGMKQRLGLALALLGGPDILMLDEPLNGLDPEAARTMRNLLINLNRDRNVTVVISSHILDQLERMCTHYGVIRDGRIVSEMTSEDVEAACAGNLKLTCSESERALALISERMPQISIAMLPEDVIKLDAKADPAAIGQLLLSEGIAVTGMHAAESDAEAFFVELMGGTDAEPPNAQTPNLRHRD